LGLVDNLGAISSACSTGSATILAAAATVLSWSTAISAASVAAGAVFSSQPVLFLQDSYGNGVPSATVTLSLFTDLGCLTGAETVGLTGNLGTTGVTGLVAFSSFQATKVGVYYVKASSGSLATSCSASALTVTHGSLNGLWFSTQPGGSVAAGTALTTQPVVYALDAYSNVVPSASIALSAFTDSGCATAGTGTISNGVLSTASTGYATFVSLSYTRAHTTFFKATSGMILLLIFDFDDIGAISSACSTGSATISAAPASGLSWSTAISAGSVAAGAIFSTQPVLFLQDTYGNGVPSTTVTLSLFTDSTCSTAAGTVGVAGNSVSTSPSGVATFSNFQATKMGVYFVRAGSGALSTSCSAAALTVTNGALNTLSFTTQPAGSVAADTALTTQPVVYAVDAYGNRVSSAAVTLSAFTNGGCTTSGSGAVANGVLSTDSSGYATYSLVSYNAAQTIFLKATSGLIFNILEAILTKYA
jgi:hypothetical protein